MLSTVGFFIWSFAMFVFGVAVGFIFCITREEK